MSGSGNGISLNQMLLDELRSLKSELSDFRNHVMDIKQDISSLKALHSDIKELRRRMTKVESNGVADLDDRVDTIEKEYAVLKELNAGERLAKLEKNEYKRQGIGAVLGAIAGVVGAAVVKILLY